jgi:hypothetical protein
MWHTMHSMSSLAQNIRDRARREYVIPAERRGEHTLTIVVGDLVKAMELRNRTPAVCTALASRLFLRENHLVLESREGPPSGLSTTTRFTYRIVAGDEGSAQADPFEGFRGAGREMFKQLGGGEAFIREEREAFGRE